MNISEIIKPEERDFLLSEMEGLLEEYDYEYSERALNKIIDKWAESKAPLINAFKKHPNYLEGKFMIAFDVDYSREIDEKGIKDFVNYISLKCIPQTELLKEEINEQRVKEMTAYLPAAIYNFLEYRLKEIKSRTIDENIATEINEIMPWAHAHTGQKTSRVINKIMTYIGYNKHPDYNREFAKYADALSPLKIKRHTILSLNPLDYLTMSFGNSWASCHTIDKANKRGMPNSYEGQYSSGTMSYMLDGTSMVLYTIGAEYNGNDYWTQPKIIRQMFHWGKDKLIQGRLYPQDNDNNGEEYTPYRNIVQKIISEIFDFPNLWTIKKGTMESYVLSEGTHYQDYNCYTNCSLSTPNDMEKNPNPMTIGAVPICIECGYTHYVSGSINCCHVPNEMRCADCGEYICEDDAIYVDGEYYCRDCVDYCSSCEEYHRSETYYIDSENRDVCEYCFNEYYTFCECCGGTLSRDEAYYVESESDYICQRCYEENYLTCEECGEIYRIEDIHDYKGRYLCDDCYDNAVEEDEKEEEEE